MKLTDLKFYSTSKNHKILRKALQSRIAEDANRSPVEKKADENPLIAEAIKRAQKHQIERR